MDSSLFSHPVSEQPRPGTLTTPQDSRYGSLFRQPVYTPAPAAEDSPHHRPAAPGKWAHDPSGRRPRR